MTERITLTRDQEIGVQKIKAFLKSDNRYFRLIGRAGRGKTTLVKYALEELIAEDSDSKFPNVIGIALAHAAKNVLMGSIPNCRTFASAYGYKERIHDDGRRTFEPSKYFEEPPVGHLDIPVFVHDEVSQYSNEMKKIIFEKTSIFSKTIFMGDNAQLPPIDPTMKIDADSPIFEMELPEECTHELKEPIRQKHGNPILDLSDVLIEEIFGNHNLNRVIMEILKPKLQDGYGYLCEPKHVIYDHYLSQEPMKNKLIAFRNNAVARINTEIRGMIFPGVKEPLVKNDLICMTNNFKSEKPFYKLQNSEQFVIKEINHFDVLPPHSYDEIECYYGKVDTAYTNSFVVTPTPDGAENYLKNYNRLMHFANQNKSLWKNVYQFTDTFSDFTMGYAINAYRSQGSTYENVYIDLIDILTVSKLTPKRKLQTIYTALTRAKQKVYFIKP